MHFFDLSGGHEFPLTPPIIFLDLSRLGDLSAKLNLSAPAGQVEKVQHFPVALAQKSSRARS